MPLVPVLSRIERNGVKIDPKVLHNHSEELTLRLAELEKKAHEIAGEEFNLSSTKQLQTILFEKQGIKPLKKRRVAPVNVGRGTGRTGAGLSVAKSDSGVSWSGEAEIDLHRQAAVDDQPENRACTYLLSPRQ